MILPQEHKLNVSPESFLKQSKRTNYCSEASAQMILSHYGIIIDQDSIHERGWTYEELQPFMESLLDVRTTTFPSIDEVKEALVSGSPVMIRILNDWKGNMHTQVIYGYEQFGDRLFIADPDVGLMTVNGRDVMNRTKSIMTFRERETAPDQFLIRAARKKRERTKERRQEFLEKKE